MWTAVDGIVAEVGVLVGSGIQAVGTMSVGMTEAGRKVRDSITLPFMENRISQRGNPCFRDGGGRIAAQFHLIVLLVASRVLRLFCYV